MQIIVINGANEPLTVNVDSSEFGWPHTHELADRHFDVAFAVERHLGGRLDGQVEPAEAIGAGMERLPFRFPFAFHSLKDKSRPLDPNSKSQHFRAKNIPFLLVALPGHHTADLSVRREERGLERQTH